MTTVAASPRVRAVATLALFAGAAAIATAPLFVRWSETGPIATAFWRIALALLVLALVTGEQVLPSTPTGWMTVAALAIIAQAGGQSLIAYAMAHLPGTFSSVGLLLQPVVAALLAWALLGETLGWLAAAGGAAVLAGIAISHRAELGSASMKCDG